MSESFSTFVMEACEPSDLLLNANIRLSSDHTSAVGGGVHRHTYQLQTIDEFAWGKYTLQLEKFGAWTNDLTANTYGMLSIYYDFTKHRYTEEYSFSINNTGEEAISQINHTLLNKPVNLGTATYRVAGIHFQFTFPTNVVGKYYSSSLSLIATLIN